MKLKPINALFIIYFVPLLMATDCGDCGCYDYEEYNVVYKGAYFSVWDTSKFQPKEVEGEVSKNAFGIEIYVEHQQDEIVFIHNTKNTSYASFGIAYAWSCSCVPPEYYFPNPIKSIQITATDTANQSEIDVTEKFTTKNYGDKDVTIPELLEEYKNQKQEYLSWRLDLTDTNDIPATATFTLTVTLDSSETFIQQTEEISFKI